MSTSVMVDTSVPALIVKFGGYPLHHGGVGAIRTLGRLGVPVYAITEDRFTPAAVSRYLHDRFVWRTTGLEDAEVLVQGLLEIGRRIGRPTMLVPTDDRAAELIAENGVALDSVFLFPRAKDAGLARRLASKRGLQELCTEYGVPSAAAVSPSSLKDIEEFAGTASFPLVVKNRELYQRPGAPAVPSTTVVRNADELLDLARLWPEDPGVVLQEYLPRQHAEDWIFHAYIGLDAQPNPVFTGVKARSYPPYAGVTSCGYVADNPELAALACDFCVRIGFQGIADLDWRLDRRDGRYKLLDFNPRVGAQFRLFETTAGTDVVRAQHLDLTGRAIPAGEQIPGRKYVVEHLDPRVWRQYRAGHDTTPPPRAAHTEFAWAARDDVMPVAAVAVRVAGRVVARLARHVTRRSPRPRRPRRTARP
jgi:predicted ATP-grasp superfamily ATP-dependent carboligase